MNIEFTDEEINIIELALFNRVTYLTKEKSLAWRVDKNHIQKSINRVSDLQDKIRRLTS